MGVLILLDPLHPPPYHERRVNHHIHLLGMVVRLRVLVPVTLDPDVSIHDHQLDVARPLLVLVVDRADLVLCNIGVDVEVCGVVRGVEVGVEFIGDHLVVAALAREELAGVVVAQAVVVGDLDAAAAGGEDLGQEGFGVEVGRLDKDGLARVAEGGDPGEVLGDVDGGFAGGAVGLAADHGAGEGWVWGDGDDGSHGFGGGLEVGSGGLGVRLDGGVEESSDGGEASFARTGLQVGYRAEDFATEVEIEMGIGRAVQGEVLFGAFGSDLGQCLGAFWYWVLPKNGQEAVE